MSPVERCGTPYRFAARLAWVPLPAPGGPKKIIARLSAMLTANEPPLTATAAHSALANKPVVIAHDELCLELLHCVHGYANHDEQRSASKIKLHVQTVEHKSPHMLIEPITHEPQMLQMNAGDHPFRKQTDNGEVDAADKRQARQNAIDVLGCVTSGPDPRNESAILPHVVGKLGGIENNAHIE